MLLYIPIPNIPYSNTQHIIDIVVILCYNISEVFFMSKSSTIYFQYPFCAYLRTTFAPSEAVPNAKSHRLWNSFFLNKSIICRQDR